MPLTLPRVPDPTTDRALQLVAQQLVLPVPQARVTNTAAISIATGTATSLTFDTERWDTGDLHSTAASTSRLTVSVSGLYSIGGNVRWAASATGVRQVGIFLNATTFIALEYRTATGGDGAQTVSTEWQLTAGDFVELNVFQDSGGALNVVKSNAFSPEFWMHRVAGFTADTLG